MSKTIRRWAGSGTCWLIVLMLLALISVPLPVLYVSCSRDTPGIILPIIYDRNFTIEYIHSVQKTPVQENFVVTGSKLRLDSTTYQSLGAGLPFSVEEGTLVVEDGKFILKDLNRIFPEIQLGLIPLARQSLIYRGKRYPLEDYFPPAALVRLQVARYPAVKIIYKRLLSY